MAVYDAFIFFNEFDLLEVRLNEHNPFVDKFILVQADRTFTGETKPLHFNINDPRFDKFKDKIVVINTELKPYPESAWENENLQREAIFTAAKYLPDDVLYFSDVDEIISRHHWKYLLSRMKIENAISVWLRMFYYFVNLETISHPWSLPKMVKAKTFLSVQMGGTELRMLSGIPLTPFPCGWHFSYVSSIENIMKKIASFSHQEFNNKEFNSRKNIEEAFRCKRDLFLREIKLRPCQFDSTWPLTMQNSDLWTPHVCKVGLIDTAKLRFFKLAVKGLASIKQVIRPLVTRLPFRRNLPNTQNQFGSYLFDDLISLRPIKIEPVEWRRLIESFGSLLPKLEGWFSARQCAELFKSIVTQVKPNSKIVEVGSWKGRSSVFASRAAAISGSTVYCVDTWEGNKGEGLDHPTVRIAQTEDVFSQFLKNTSLYGSDNIIICRGDSAEVASSWGHGPIDFLFIDASHDYDSVLKDLRAWVPRVKPGGIICGDDWNLDDCIELKGSVRKAFEDFFNSPLPNLGIVERFWAHQV